MSANDELDAIKALTHRLTEWGVDGASDKAKLYIGDLVNHGWAMQAHIRQLRRPPMKSEECATHPGEYHDFCRACVADRKAAAEVVARPDGTWTPSRIRESLHRGEAEHG